MRGSVINRLWLLRYSIYLFACISLAPNISSADETSAFFTRLKLYAEIANAAYLPELEARGIIEAQGYRLTQYRSVEGVEVNYLLATNDALKHQIIAVRGTANVENAIADLSLKLLPDKHAHIALHQGFAQAAEGVYQGALPLLKKNYTISTTGHSLGGAIAVILSMYLSVDQYSLGPIITFGQPKVTNVRGALVYQNLDIIRVVTSQDLVPLLPPVDVIDINDLDIYWHLGKEIILMNGHDYAVLEGVKSMMRATRVLNAKLSQENLEKHKMAGYIDQVDSKVESANPVHYKTGIDLLKLFGE